MGNIKRQDAPYVLAQCESPNGEWNITIKGPGMGFRGPPPPPLWLDVRRIGDCSVFLVPFGYECAVSEIELRCGLPDDVLAVYIRGECYALFRYGARRGRNREYGRMPPHERPFSDAEIEWVCAKRHWQRKGFNPWKGSVK